MQYSNESLDRMKKIGELKEAWIIPYANNFRWKQDIDFIRKQSNSIKEVDILMENWAIWEFKTAWRIILSRWMWKLLFITIRDHKWDIQVCFMKDKIIFNTGKEEVSEIQITWENKTAFKIAEKFCHIWDYIWITWDLFITKHWELTIFVRDFQILSKAIRPLPEKFHWLTDEETIYRQRYLDLIVNEESYKRMVFRSNFIRKLRDFYLKNWFTEITTPTLWISASWAAAKPFITHHNDFWENVFLRIAPEIGLKMATVWRFEKVFEFATNFRNEWSDPSHLQEFNVVEHYAAWWNFEDNINFTEEMFDYLFTELNLERKISVKDKEWKARIVDFSTPFEKIDYVEWVKKACWIDVSKYINWEEERLIEDIKKAWVNFEWMEKMAVPTLIDYLYKKVLRPSITWPAFVYNYPKTLQPLARQNDENPNIVEQFQLVVNGWEINKAYSELVDPKIQQENFDIQAGAIEKWDEEATQWDDDFILAMEYWMPCQSGFGMGFDRILAILTSQDNLRDVVLFPLMKSEKKEKKEEKEKRQWEQLKKLVEEMWAEKAIGKLRKNYKQ